MTKKEIYDTLIRVSKSISRKKEGALFVIARKECFKGVYDPLYPQIIRNAFVSEKGVEAVLEKLASLDGATLISEEGEILAFGVRLNKMRTLPGFGTKHSAARGITEHIPESTAILISEESGWIKIFKQGNIAIETDSTEMPKSISQKVVSFLSDGDTALFTAAGASAALLGSAALPPVLIAGGVYLAMKTATNMLKKHLKG